MAGGAQPARIVILGGGCVGLNTALRLQKKLRGAEASVTVVDPQPHMTYQPFLPEAAAGSIQPRHVTVPLRTTLKRCHVRTARVAGVNQEQKFVTVETDAGTTERIDYDVLVVALGAITRLLPVPGLAEHGIGIKTVGEAAYLRNHVLSRMDLAASTTDPERRRKLLTFTVIGGGFAGIEALGELEDMARDACKYYPTLSPEDLRWVLVEATGRILYEVRESLGEYTVERLRKRGVDVRLDSRVTSVHDGRVELHDGTVFDSDTIIWTAGVKANPVLAGSGLPLDARGRVLATSELRVQGTTDVWVAGDCAAVPDLARTEEDPNATCPPNAQHAVRQAKVLADNIMASLREKPTREYRHKNVGAVASLGLHKGVADVYGFKAKGFVAWGMHRAYHVAKVPTFHRKARIVMGWLGAGLFGREIVSVGQINNPHAEFERAASELTSAR